MNEIYSASLLYHLFLSCYIFKYIAIVDGEWGGYEKHPFDGEFCPQLRFYLCLCGNRDGDEDDFEGDGEGN